MRFRSATDAVDLFDQGRFALRDGIEIDALLTGSF
jgi:hypothetical protein